jgi:hypothetical protein
VIYDINNQLVDAFHQVLLDEAQTTGNQGTSKGPAIAVEDFPGATTAEIEAWLGRCSESVQEPLPA